MNKEQPTYYGIMPASVRYDKNISSSAKVLYAEITALSNINGYCYANNNYFSELYNVENRAITRWISELVDNGHLRRMIIYHEDAKVIKERRLYINNPDVMSKIADPHAKNDRRPPVKKDLDNNTSINNTSINNTSIINKACIDNLDYMPIVLEWLAYKKLIKSNYKTERGLKSCCTELINLTKGNAELAKQYVDNAINNEWKGIYKPKNNEWNNGTSENTEEKPELENKELEQAKKAGLTQHGF